MSEMRNTGNNNRTIIRQQQESSSIPARDEYYNNYNPARAREATNDTPLPPAEIMQTIAEEYHNNIGPMITAVAAGIIERALKSGMEPQTVILAIQETGMCSRPSPYYLSAVLRRWAETGVVVCRPRRDELGVLTTKARPWWK